jgi:hypothetical protein
MKLFSGLSAVFTGMLVLSTCAGEPVKIIFRPDPPEPPYQHEQVYEPYELTGHQDAATGKAVPEWVSRFLERGIEGVEALEAFSNHYVFIGTNRGGNFNALSHWAEGFTVVQDFPRLAAVRIEQRLISAASLYPDDEYGEFFEVLVKTASDAVYSGAEKEAAFWIQRRFYDESPQGREQYDFFILVTIEKTLFQTQVQELLTRITTRVPPSRDQAAAINRIRETFFENF